MGAGIGRAIVGGQSAGGPKAGAAVDIVRPDVGSSRGAAAEDWATPAARAADAIAWDIAAVAGGLNAGWVKADIRTDCEFEVWRVGDGGLNAGCVKAAIRTEFSRPEEDCVGPDVDRALSPGFISATLADIIRESAPFDPSAKSGGWVPSCCAVAIDAIATAPPMSPPTGISIAAGPEALVIGMNIEAIAGVIAWAWMAPSANCGVKVIVCGRSGSSLSPA